MLEGWGGARWRLGSGVEAGGVRWRLGGGGVEEDRGTHKTGIFHRTRPERSCDPSSVCTHPLHGFYSSRLPGSNKSVDRYKRTRERRLTMMAANAFPTVLILPLCPIRHTLRLFSSLLVLGLGDSLLP